MANADCGAAGSGFPCISPIRRRPRRMINCLLLCGDDDDARYYLAGFAFSIGFGKQSAKKVIRFRASES